MSADPESQKQSIARLIGGQIVDESQRVAVSIKGSVKGFPATFEAIMPGWPFGVMYIVQRKAAAGSAASNPAQSGTRINLYPRMGRGFASIFTHILLFEGSSMPVGDKQLEGQFNFTYDSRELAQRFVSIADVPEHLRALEQTSNFSELIIRTDAGIYLAQPKSLKALDLQVCKETFVLMGQLVEILSEHFD